MFRVSFGEYEVCCQADGLPAMLSEYQQRATLAEDFGVADEAGASVCFLSIGRPHQWPFLVVVQRYSPAGCGFHPGVLLVPAFYVAIEWLAERIRPRSVASRSPGREEGVSPGGS